MSDGLSQRDVQSILRVEVECHLQDRNSGICSTGPTLRQQAESLKREKEAAEKLSGQNSIPASPTSPAHPFIAWTQVTSICPYDAMLLLLHPLHLLLCA